MKLETERLILRPFKKKDNEAVFNIYSDEKTCRYLLHGVWTDENRKENFQKKLNNKELTENSMLNLAVTYVDQVIGDISVWYTAMKDMVEIGYSFLASFSGEGYATEAIKEIIEWGFKVKKVHRIQANLDARNTGSAKLCERVGMRKEAHFIQDFWNKGEWTDSLVYGILETDCINGK